jgi:large subunit ribosomal protein L4
MLKLIEEKLPKELTGAKANLNLLAQVVHVMRERSHVGLRQTKTRSEINRTTKKVYKQKGTGGARHGSRRANLFVGGGVAFGPRALRRVLTLPTALKLKAKSYAFSVKANEKEIKLVEGLSKVAKTKEVAEFLKKVEGKRFSFIISDKNLSAVRYLRNLSNCEVFLYKDVNAFQISEGGLGSPQL